MGASGILITSEPNFEPITGDMGDWESALRRGDVNPNIEHAAYFDKNGNPVIGFEGDEHSVGIDRKHIFDVPGGTMTHYHPDKDFGGTLSMQDLWLFAKSGWDEMRAVTSQGYAYSVKANAKTNKKGLEKWVNSKKKLMQRNFNRAYAASIRQATTPLKSGPNKGKVKLVNHTTGKVTYRKPMTKAQATKYARTYATNMFDASFKKNLKKFGVKYDKAKRRGITPKSTLPVVG